MKTSRRRLLGGLATAAVLMLGQAGLALGASPSPDAPPSGPTGEEMLSVQPSLLSITASPGTTTTARLTLRAAAALAVSIQSQGLAQATDGSFNAVPEAQDTTSYSARTMMSPSPTALSVQPGDSVEISVEITVPPDAGEGTRYGILTITGLPPGVEIDPNVGFGVQLGVSTIVHIADTAQTKTGEIKKISIDAALPGQALPITVSFQNTGNTHYGAIPNELVTSSTLQDASGAVIATADAAGSQVSVIPSFFRHVALTMEPTQPLVAGASYHLEVGLGLRDGTILDRKALDFTWTGGEVLGATSAPVQAPTVTRPGLPTDPAIIAIAALLGALVAVVLLWAASRRRRRGRATGDASLEP